MNKKIYLIYRPAMEYEDNMEPYLITSSKKKAAAICAEVFEHYNNILKDIPEEPEPNYEVGSDEIHYEWQDKRDEIIKKSLENPPYNIKFVWSDLISEYSKNYGGLSTGLLKVMELPLI